MFTEVENCIFGIVQSRAVHLANKIAISEHWVDSTPSSRPLLYWVSHDDVTAILMYRAAERTAWASSMKQSALFFAANSCAVQPYMGSGDISPLKLPDSFL